jgi:superfamily II RNA helicase
MSSLEYMNKIIKTIDLIELQFTKFHNQMPPLNNKGFNKLDDWQIKVIQNIDNNISTIINAPTSAGKTVLSGYVATKGRVLYIVPTDALAWQMSSYLGGILDLNIPIITDTYQTLNSRDNMIDLLNKSNIIVGTTEILVDYLPFMKNNFNWLVFDEIHMIGKNEGSAMEYILKLLPNIPFLALSATIGNLNDFASWLSIVTKINIDKIVCNKRFYNFQKFYYNNENNSLNSIHPLGLVDAKDFIDKSILNKQLDPTPPSTWDLTLKLKSKFELKDLDPYIYFKIDQRIELNETIIYFNKLIEFMINNYNKDIEDILNNYKLENLLTANIDLVKLAFNLKNNNKTPAIIFHKNTLACMKMIFDFSKNIDNLENLKYPKLYSERLKLLKNNKNLEKKVEVKEEQTKKSFKNMFLEGNDEISNIQSISLQEPHEDFILNNNQYFTEDTVEGWVKDLKNYFPNTGECYHFIIKLLWRGVGIYVKGLPDAYLRIVQSLACKKQLAIVISDESLVFGISMPFRSVVLINDNKYSDNLDSMLYHQMIGRAGRRGLDREGNIIFAGFNWERIKTLTTHKQPNITGLNKINYSIDHVNLLSKLNNTNQDWNIIKQNKLFDYYIKYQDLTDINNTDCILTPNDNKLTDINHLYLNWKFRYSNEGIIISEIFPFIKKAFDYKDYKLEVNQVNLAHFLCQFIGIEKAENNQILEEYELLKIHPFNTIYDILKNKNIILFKNIDDRLFKSIESNNLVDNENNLRQRLFEFGQKLKIVQHYCFYSKIINLTKLFGKLLTRIWWIYHSSSPIMKPYYNFYN